jgi:hypothetical protein
MRVEEGSVESNKRLKSFIGSYKRNKINGDMMCTPHFEQGLSWSHRSQPSDKSDIQISCETFGTYVRFKRLLHKHL